MRYEWAVVGAKVVCKKNELWDDPFNVARMQTLIGMGYVFPEEGQVYTIREIGDEDPLGIGLREIVNPRVPLIVGGTKEILFAITCFRPLVKPLPESITQFLNVPLVKGRIHETV